MTRPLTPHYSYRFTIQNSTPKRSRVALLQRYRPLIERADNDIGF